MCTLTLGAFWGARVLLEARGRCRFGELAEGEGTSAAQELWDTLLRICCEIEFSLWSLSGDGYNHLVTENKSTQKNG